MERSKYHRIDETLRRKIKTSEKSMYRLAKESGVPRPSISRFVSGKRQDLSLKSAANLAEVLFDGFGTEYISGVNQTLQRIEEIVGIAQNQICEISIGYEAYPSVLEAIKSRVNQTGIAYKRLQSGGATPQLIEHLRKIQNYPNVEIRNTQQTGYPIVLVTESDAMLQLPRNGTELDGIHFSESHVRLFSNYFDRAFDAIGTSKHEG